MAASSDWYAVADRGAKSRFRLYGFLGCVIAAAILVGALFLARYQFYPSTAGRADAWTYQFYAFRFREHGLFYDFGTYRTYGYPFFLYVLTYVSGFDNAKLSLAAGVVQFSLFFAAVLWLASLTARDSPRFALALLAGLLLHPFVLSIVTDALSDGLSVVAFVVLVALAVQLGKCDRAGGVACLAAGAFIAAAALMVRPANIAIFAAWHGAVFVGVGFLPHPKADRMFFMIANASLFFIAGGIVWGPQLLYNFAHYGDFTVLPVCRLGDYQVAYGAMVWKYETIVTGNVASQRNYLNPLFGDVLPGGSGWRWYLQQPVAGIATILAHVFNAFSVTNLFTYIRDSSPPYDLPLRVLFWALNIGGLVGIAKYAPSLFRRDVVSPYACAAALVALSTIGIVAMNSVAAVEVRFNVIPIAALAVMGIAWLLDLVSGVERFHRPLAAGCALTLLACVTGSYAMDRLGTSAMVKLTPAFNPVAQRCFLLNEGQGSKWHDAVREHDTAMLRRRSSSRP